MKGACSLPQVADSTQQAVKQYLPPRLEREGAASYNGVHLQEKLGRSMSHKRIRTPILLIVGFVLFVGALVYLVASSLVKRDMPTFVPSPAGVVRPDAGTLVLDTVTVDASDPQTWRFFDFTKGTILAATDTTGWDLAFRRFHVIAAGAVADLGHASFELVREAPPNGYVETTVDRDTVNAAIHRWYSYGMLSHLLTPKGNIYAVRTSDGRYAKLEFLSYYCEGLRAGCLTFRYAYQPSGAREFK